MLTFYPSRIPGSKGHRIPDPQYWCCGTGPEGQCCDYGSGIRDEQPVSYFLEFRPIFCFFGVNKPKFFDSDPGWKYSDPGWKEVRSGLNIPDP